MGCGEVNGEAYWMFNDTTIDKVVKLNILSKLDDEYHLMYYLVNVQDQEGRDISSLVLSQTRTKHQKHQILYCDVRLTENRLQQH